MKKKTFKSLIATLAVVALVAVPTGTSVVNASGIARADLCSHPTLTMETVREFYFVDYEVHIRNDVQVFTCTECGEVVQRVSNPVEEAHYDIGDGMCECGTYFN